MVKIQELHDTNKHYKNVILIKNNFLADLKSISWIRFQKKLM
jgi:hypothetical protein